MKVRHKPQKLPRSQRFPIQSQYNVAAYIVCAENYFWSRRNRKYGNLTSAELKKKVLRRSTNDDRTTTANFRQKRHLPTNRKWKYGGNPTDELAVIDFLFDPIQYMGLSATVWTLETTSGFGGSGSTEI